MPTANHPPLWRVTRADSTVYILAGRPPMAEPWFAPMADAALEGAREFWSEAPEASSDSQQLAFKYGVDLARPLAKAIPPETQKRMNEAAVRLSVAPAVLSPLRPWLAAQVLRSALNGKRNSDPDTAPEAHFRKQALARGVPAFSEYGTTEHLLADFAGLSPAAETQFLEVALDEFEEPPEMDFARARGWRNGDLTGEPERAAALAERYPAFYSELAVRRNRDWVPRIQRMLGEPGTVLLVVGLGHLVGPDSLVDMLAAAGLTADRV
jgi:uncharacterized protein YbaP (TraB family)